MSVDLILGETAVRFGVKGRKGDKLSGHRVKTLPLVIYSHKANSICDKAGLAQIFHNRTTEGTELQAC